MTEQKDRQGHYMRVGDRAHEVIAVALRSNLPSSRGQRAFTLARIAREVFMEHPVQYRPREAFLDAVTAAGVYLNRFRPESPARFLGAEVPLDRGRADVIHELASGRVLIDEVKLGMERHLEPTVRAQITRYLDRGSEAPGFPLLRCSTLLGASARPLDDLHGAGPKRHSVGDIGLQGKVESDEIPRHSDDSGSA